MKKFAVLLVFFAVIACKSNVITPRPVVGDKNGTELQEADFSELKNFESDNLSETAPAILKTCERILEKPQFLTASAIRIDTDAYKAVCKKYIDEQPQSDDEIRLFLRENFKPYLVMYGLKEEGRFTSYYEAEIRASKHMTDKYKYPVYGRPNDLIEVRLRDFDEQLPDRRLVMRVESGRGIPYYSRAEIERTKIDAPVILWGDDSVDIFLMQIQGSAVALLDNGDYVRVRYAENNGHKFVGIGKILSDKGLLKQGEASMDKIRDWLKANPELAAENMDKNPRFIFHAFSEADGPVGAMGVTLTPGRSLAVDTAYIPLGSLLWLETKAPDGKPLEKLVAAQDIGGAIKGAVRGDYFWGHGEEALLSAGKMNSVGRYYILLPKGAKVDIRQ